MPHEKPSKPTKPEPSDRTEKLKHKNNSEAAPLIRHKTVKWQGPAIEGQQVWYNALNERYTTAQGYGLIEDGWVFVMHIDRERAVIREVKA